MANLKPNVQRYPNRDRAKFEQANADAKGVNLYIDDTDNKLYAIFGDNSVRVATAGVDGTITFPVAP